MNNVASQAPPGDNFGTFLRKKYFCDNILGAPPGRFCFAVLQKIDARSYVFAKSPQSRLTFASDLVKIFTRQGNIIIIKIS